MKKDKWIWMPHPGHFICARDCRFHLNTYVGKYIVSTVGEYLPDSLVRDILAESRGVVLEGMGDNRLADYMKKLGFEELGYGRKYETMVFPAEKRDSICCPYTASDWSGLEMDGYNSPDEATEGHMKFCLKWSKK